MPETRTPSVLLVVILLAVLVEPFLLALLFTGRGEGPARSDPSPGLRRAIEELSREVRRLGAARAGPGRVPAPPLDAKTADRLARALERLERGEAARPAGIEPAGEGGEEPAPVRKRPPSRQEEVDDLVRELIEKRGRGERIPTTLLFRRTAQEILIQFGVPDETLVSAAGVAWRYRRADGRSFTVQLVDGRVARFMF